MLDCGASEFPGDTVQLNNAFVMPGFNDAHTHLGGAARVNCAFALWSDFCCGIAEPLEGRSRQDKPGEWIVGNGWDQTKWPDKQFPNRAELDAVAPDNPVFLEHVSGHIAVVNSQALKHAEIATDTKNPGGGEIERGADGEATGILKEGAAMQLVEQRIPSPKEDELQHGSELVFSELAQNGVTFGSETIRMGRF